MVAVPNGPLLPGKMIAFLPGIIGSFPPRMSMHSLLSVRQRHATGDGWMHSQDEGKEPGWWHRNGGGGTVNEAFAVQA